MASEKPKPTIMVMVGITGDLAQRYLLPAITKLAAADRLPSEFRLIGISRRNVDVTSVLKDQHDAPYLRDHLEMRQMDLDDAAAYRELARDLDVLSSEQRGDTQRIFYLSVPPAVSSPIVGHLGEAGVAKVPNTKLMMEKPFGSDLASARELVTHLTKHFNEEQIYRIDHYVAKEMVQSLVTMRRQSPAIAALWRPELIERVEISALEAIDIEGRATFYEQTGALRDLVQSHLLQIMAHVVMSLPPADAGAEALQAARLAALRSFELAPGPIAATARRGQYEGYRAEVENDASMTETFVELHLHAKNAAWAEVALQLTTGKALSQRLAEINLTFKPLAEGVPKQTLTLRIQPDAAIMLEAALKTPGYNDETLVRSLDYTYVPSDGQEVDAYGRVLLDALRGDRHLFISSDEVIASWEVIDPVQRAWAVATDDLLTYPKGADGKSV